MADTGGIRAGKAFVEVYADRTKLDRTLKSISSDLKAFGAGISSLGKKFMVLGAGIVAPMLGAAASFAKFGSELNDMSARTGMGTNALSELGFAAEQSGASLENVEVAVKKMQKAISAATGGPLAALKGMAPEDQFQAVGEAIAAIPDPTARAAKALEIFGKSGTALLPMLGDMKALRAEAVRLGLSIGPEEAAAADALGDSWDKCKATFKGAAMAIGGALAPMLTGLAEKVATGIAAVRQWVGENKALIVNIFMVGVAAVAAGAGLFVLGKAISLIGMIFTTTLAVCKAAVIAFSLVSNAALLLSNPFVLVGLAAVALGGYLLYATGAAGKAATWISSTFATILSEVTSTFGVIAESMAAGDFVSAAKVGCSLLLLYWAQTVLGISRLWEYFKQIYDEITSGLAIGFINACAAIQDMWVSMLGAMSKLWERWAQSTIVEGFADLIAPIMAKILGVDEGQLRKTMAEDFARKRANQPNDRAAIDADTAKKRAAIEKDRQGQVDVVGADLEGRNKQRDAELKKGEQQVVDARKEWEDAKNKAKDAAAAGGGTESNFAGAADGLDLTNAGPKSSVRGTFSASAAAGLGTDRIGNRIANATEKTFQFVGEQTTVLKELVAKLEAAP